MCETKNRKLTKMLQIKHTRTYTHRYTYTRACAYVFTYYACMHMKYILLDIDMVVRGLRQKRGYKNMYYSKLFRERAVKD